MSEQLFVIGLGIGDDADSAWFGSGLALEAAVAADPFVTTPIGTSLTRILFTYGTNSIGVDAPAERRWVLAASGEAGEATIRLPRDSAAASTTYLNPDGGSLVRILSEGGCGEWFGIVADIDDSDPNLLGITAYQPGKLLGIRQLDAGPIRNTTAGYMATTILREALVGVRGLSLPNAPFEGGTLGEREFDPSGDAWSGLAALMDASGAEIDVTAAGEINWIGPLANATRYDTLLVAGGNLQEASYRTVGAGRLAEVTAGAGPDAFTARRGDAAADGWPGQATIDGTAQSAQRELEARADAAILIGGGVTSEHWSIRERDFVNVLIPWAQFGGRLHRCRVLARSLADGEALMRLELQVMRPIAPTTISAVGAGARQPPPQRPSTRAKRATYAGSFAQIFAQIKRNFLGRDETRWT